MNRYIRLLLITVTFFWGTSFAAAKIGLHELHPLSLVVLRFTLASVIFGVILLRMGKAGKIEAGDIPSFLVLGFLGITSYFYIQFTGLLYTTTIHSALIIATSPIIVGLISATLHLERVNKATYCGIGLAFIGVTLIITGGNFEGILQSKTIKGDLMLLSNAVVWAGITLYGKKLLSKYRPIVAMAYMHIFGTILLLPMVFIPGLSASVGVGKEIFNLSWPTIIAVLYLAVFCSVFGYYVWYTAVERIGPISTSVFTYLNPLFASLTGVILLSEKVVPLTIVGGCLVMAGVYLTNHFRPTEKNAQELPLTK